METKIIVQVDFYATIKSAFGTQSMRIDLSPPATVGQLLESICQSCQRSEVILDGSGQLRKDITVLRNGRNIQFLNGPQTEMRNGDKIAIFPPVAGG
jgi:molybdopterin synthase sulfur carrier subunit